MSNLNESSEYHPLPPHSDAQAAEDAVHLPATEAMTRDSLLGDSGDPLADFMPEPDPPSPRDADPLAAFLPESTIRARHTPAPPQPPGAHRRSGARGGSTVGSADQDAWPDAGWHAPGAGHIGPDVGLSRIPDTIWTDLFKPPADVHRQPDPPPDPSVGLTGALRVTSRSASRAGSSGQVVRLLWAASVAIIGVASLEFMVLELNHLWKPPNRVSAPTSVSAPAPPAAGPAVEAPRQEAAVVTPPAVKPVEQDKIQADKIQADVRDVRPRSEGQLSRQPSASRAPVSIASKAPETVRPDDSAPSAALPAAPTPPVAKAPVAELAAVDPSLLSRPPSSPPPPAAVMTTGTVVQANHREAIQRVLDAYKDSYDRLDAPSAALIWRGVDTRALARAFSSLDSQDLSLDECQVSITVPQATAICRGELRYVRRVGTPTPRVLRASWTIDLERDADRWVIASVKVH